MRRNIQRLLSVLTLAITLICPLKGWAQESSIQDTRFRNVNVCRNLSDYIKQCMHFDSALGLSEVCPLEKAHTKVYRRRIKRIELSVEFKRSCDSLALS